MTKDAWSRASRPSLNALVLTRRRSGVPEDFAPVNAETVSETTFNGKPFRAWPLGGKTRTIRGETELQVAFVCVVLGCSLCYVYVIVLHRTRSPIEVVLDAQARPLYSQRALQAGRPTDTARGLYASAKIRPLCASACSTLVPERDSVDIMCGCLSMAARKVSSLTLS